MLNTPVYNSVQEVAAAIKAVGPDKVALFLDFDGSLVGFKDNPEEVELPSHVLGYIKTIYDATGGAVAFVTGRDREFIDRNLGGFLIPASFGHGAEMRTSFGGAVKPTATRIDIDALNSLIQKRFGHEPHADIKFEYKKQATAIHWSMSKRPGEWMSIVGEGMAQTIVDEHNAMHPDAQVKYEEGHMVVEIGSSSASKGHAVHAFMQIPPFAGRIPFFIGDQNADKSGMIVAHELAQAMGAVVQNSIGIAAESPKIARLRLETPLHTQAVLGDIAGTWGNIKRPALVAG